jgi:hypothetical protein
LAVGQINLYCHFWDEFNLVLFHCSQGLDKLQYIWCYCVKLIANEWHSYQFKFFFAGSFCLTYILAKGVEICQTICIYMDAINIFFFLQDFFFILPLLSKGWNMQIKWNLYGCHRRKHTSAYSLFSKQFGGWKWKLLLALMLFNIFWRYISLITMI